MNEAEDLLRFPCRVLIKAIGDHRPGFTDEVVQAVSRRAAFDPAADLTSRLSANRRYMAITVTIEAHSRQQLEAIYRDIRALDAVHFML